MQLNGAFFFFFFIPVEYCLFPLPPPRFLFLFKWEAFPGFTLPSSQALLPGSSPWLFSLAHGAIELVLSLPLLYSGYRLDLI